MCWSPDLTLVPGHTEAERLFRPWWDRVGDTAVYGLVVLGGLLLPSSLATTYPLDCTPCTGAGDLCSRLNMSG